MGILAFLKIKKVKLFGINEEINTTDSNEVDTLTKKQRIWQQKDKLLAALFETIGQEHICLP